MSRWRPPPPHPPPQMRCCWHCHWRLSRQRTTRCLGSHQQRRRIDSPPRHLAAAISVRLHHPGDHRLLPPLETCNGLDPVEGLLLGRSRRCAFPPRPPPPPPSSIIRYPWPVVGVDQRQSEGLNAMLLHLLHLSHSSHAISYLLHLSHAILHLSHLSHACAHVIKKFTMTSQKGSERCQNL